MAELLKVSHLKKYFQVAKGVLHAVDDVSFCRFVNDVLQEEGKRRGPVWESSN